MRQLLLDLLPDVPATFDNFVTGSNAEALTALASWLAPDNREPLLLLWGEAGSGKSHLLRASGGRFHDTRCDPDLDRFDGRAVFHAIDDVHALGERGQVVLFGLINRLLAEGGRLLAAAGDPPSRLALRDDLRTRLASGLVYRLQPLADEEKLAALREHARARGVVLPPTALDYLLARAPRDMRSLANLLTEVERRASESKRPVTLPLLREVLRSFHRRQASA